MSNKNPFEIRSEVLSMAKEYLDQQYQMNVEFARRIFDEAVEAKTVALDSWKSYVPEMYSVEDLMKKAQELYGFVLKKD